MIKSVLIVDDIPFVRKVLAEVLTECGYRIAGEASSGEEALAKFSTLKPDIVTMDIVMPHMSGIEATRKIMTIDPYAIVVIVTGMDQEHFTIEAIQAGARDIILKPFQKAEVQRILDRATGRQSETSAAKVGS